MMTYDRNHNPITTGSRVMVNGTGKTGVIKAIYGQGLDTIHLRREKTVEVDGLADRIEPVELIRLGFH
ncbi:putative selenium delivery protein YdfZ [Shimwellia pseudoproteus]|uniref:putative selenium delivery protein YdfZ n=1 Tax=Shimwellia pseudoproteus TaxID=570012 RepID=UPI0018EC9650|nr:putative selenium delivery protein YdfZ [Shimwellia pseudoproteus]MBJ3813654.1 putative selenium delivery protein YdfZ [Shimwellia pseudoproteus]